MTCPTCREERDSSDFYAPTSMVKSCRKCHRARVKHYQELARGRDPEGYAEKRRRQTRESQRRLRFKMSPERFAALHALSGGRCAICRRERSLVVDHDHKCCAGDRTCGDCLRGLLCSTCNSGIGLLGDDQQVLLAAAEYLASYARPSTKTLEAVGRSLR